MIVTQPLAVRLVLSVLLGKITNLRSPKVHALAPSLAESSPRRLPSQDAYAGSLEFRRTLDLHLTVCTVNSGENRGRAKLF